MSRIQIERAISQQQQEELGIPRWPIWEKAISTFPWTYDSSETCYLSAGEVIVTPKGGEPVTISAGDLATFPAGMSCTWQITADLKKHYFFD
ncbi:cupin domain-containing protein [Chitinibacter bivalviorum]|uniref:Cupin domain-containing protein n=1 Tax=Chitinibacter bivalviorum TaxID=2739434 RepID=A0A7H9BGY8_9NEIS|nr:cupin domain-containing protein [Chitinibacter bivalviorum]QLG87211.1 cupin domain-containing protein [Chitinibacter bivalviorum]